MAIFKFFENKTTFILKKMFTQTYKMQWLKYRYLWSSSHTSRIKQKQNMIIFIILKDITTFKCLWDTLYMYLMCCIRTRGSSRREWLTRLNGSRRANGSREKHVAFAVFTLTHSRTRLAAVRVFFAEQSTKTFPGRRSRSKGIARPPNIYNISRELIGRIFNCTHVRLA